VLIVRTRRLVLKAVAFRSLDQGCGERLKIEVIFVYMSWWKTIYLENDIYVFTKSFGVEAKRLRRTTYLCDYPHIRVSPECAVHEEAPATVFSRCR
jgi:hypothetical protein